MRKSIAKLRPAILVFILLNAVFIIFRDEIKSRGFEISVLIFGNLLLFFTSLLSFMLLAKGMNSKSNPVFFRMFYSSFLIKFFFLAIAAFVYIIYSNKEVNKPGLFFCLGLYLVYTVIEVSALLKLSKAGSHA